MLNYKKVHFNRYQNMLTLVHVVEHVDAFGYIEYMAISEYITNCI